MRDRKPKQEKKYEELLLEVRRVTRVTTGGRRLSFRATIIVWNKKGKIWLWIAKSWDVAWAVSKATHDAYKNMFLVPIVWSNTVPYTVTNKYKSAIVKLIPAGAWTWLKAWSAVRSVLNLAGYNNILSKIIWTNNKLNNALATIYALSMFKAERPVQDETDDEVTEPVVEEKKTRTSNPKMDKSAKPAPRKAAPKAKPQTAEEATDAKSPKIDKVEKTSKTAKPAVKKETIKKVVLTEVKKTKKAETTEEAPVKKSTKKPTKKAE